MKNNTIVIIVVIAVVVIIFMLWQQAQAKANSDAQMLAMMQNQNNQGQANLWSSMDNWGNIITGIGGLFGSTQDDGETFEDGTGQRLVNTRQYRNSPFPNQQQSATIGFNNLQSMVETGTGVQLNYG